jgi:hypothetical protein
MNRRKFCLTSVAAAISGAAAGLACLPAGGQPNLATPVTSMPSIRVYKFIYDRRYSAAQAFGDAAEDSRSTATIVAIAGDITALWTSDLRLWWSAGGGAIAGMTTTRTLFCLEQLAKDYWMRVVMRAEHGITEENDFAHRLTASESMIPQMRSALIATDWPRKMPAVLATCHAADGASRTSRLIESTCDDHWAMKDEKLVSFVIA